MTTLSKVTKERSKSDVLTYIDDSKHTDLDEEVHHQFKKLHKGIVVKKVSRRGNMRSLKLYLAPNNNFLKWSSKYISHRLGRSNKRKTN